MQSCRHEEADSQMILHNMFDAAKSVCQKIMLRTVDRDVVILAVTAVKQLNIQEAWIAFGVQKHFHFLAVHEMTAALGPDRSRCLPVFHSFTGCVTVYSFNGIGKKMAWNVWQTFDDATKAFKSLSSAPEYLKI